MSTLNTMMQKAKEYTLSHYKIVQPWDSIGLRLEYDFDSLEELEEWITKRETWNKLSYGDIYDILAYKKDGEIKINKTRLCRIYYNQFHREVIIAEEDYEGSSKLLINSVHTRLQRFILQFVKNHLAQYEDYQYTGFIYSIGDDNYQHIKLLIEGEDNVDQINEKVQLVAHFCQFTICIEEDNYLKREPDKCKCGKGLWVLYEEDVDEINYHYDNLANNYGVHLTVTNY